MSKLIKNTLISLACLVIADFILFRWLDLPIATFFHRASHGAYSWFGYHVVYPLFLSPLWCKICLSIFVVGIILHFMIKNKFIGRSIVFFSLAYLVSFGATLVLKMLLGRYRPELYFSKHLYGFHYLTAVHNFMSMPSGHATAIFALLMGLARIIKQRVVTAGLFIIASVCAFSRVVIGAHYPSDVLTGAVVALLSLYWVAYLMNYRQARA
jgi:membrane-associated phospholipid phosphatase